MLFSIPITGLPKIIPNNPLTTYLQVKNCNVTRQSVSSFDPDEMAIKVRSVYIWFVPVRCKYVYHSIYTSIIRLPKIIPDNPLTSFLQVKNCNVTRQCVSSFDLDEMAIKVGLVCNWFVPAWCKYIYHSLYISITRSLKIIPNNPLTTFLQVKNCNVTRQSVSSFDPDEMAIKVGSVYIWYESLIILYSFSCPARQFSHQTRVRTRARPPAPMAA